MQLLTVGYRHSLAEQAGKSLPGERRLALSASLADLYQNLTKKDQVLLPIYNTQQGYDLAMLNWLLGQRLKIVDRVIQRPKFCLAAQSPRFTQVVSSPARWSLAGSKIRTHRGLKHELVDSPQRSLQASFQSDDTAVICTLEEAKGYRFGFRYELQHEELEQHFYVAGFDLPHDTRVTSLLSLETEKPLQTVLTMVGHFCKNHNLELLDLQTLPGSEQKRKMLLWLGADFRLAKMYQLITYLEDLGLGKLIVVGGY